ncbi:MAG: 4-(cytidine 5'-diphospho)-2-C-methyl-D-erythritol kinase [Cohaesibacteraceae bacterium]|nr:4-(cytidine 5'-diphospho)-2-C-methyl-D-erythritol kinase [Cohaesibacteraceae bacterium]
MCRKITVLAPAKINLALHVTGRRPDGFHELETCVIFGGAADRISISHCELDSATSTSPRISVHGRFADKLGNAADNIVLKAAVLLMQQAKDDSLVSSVPFCETLISLDKRLPVASGIGGGSSDAAAVLRGLNEFWELGYSPSKLEVMSVSLGSDVPMCVRNMPVLATGTGTELENLPDLPDFAIVLVHPGFALSTPDVFAKLVEKNNTRLPVIPEVFGDLSSLANWLETARNDLEPAAIKLCPEVRMCLDHLKQTGGCTLARMSGSGATCFGIFETRLQADRAQVKLMSEIPDYWIQSGSMISLR